MRRGFSNFQRIFTFGAIGATIAFPSLVYLVPPGHRAVVFDRFSGVLDEVKGEGFHLKIPLIQYPTIYETRTKPTKIESQTGSKDLQTVSLSLRLLYRPDPLKVDDIHRKLGPYYDAKILPSLGNEILKATVAQYDASELITQRELVSRQIREGLTNRAKEFNIILDDVSIIDVSFSPEFTSAIEQKQVAQQEAERSKFIVLRGEQEKLAAIIRAQGEAEAARVLIEAMKSSPSFVELRRIEAAREISETLSHNKNVTYIPQGKDGNNILLGLGRN